MNAFRTLFPQLSETVYGKPLVYLDNAATSLRPETVIRKWEEMSVKFNSNLHRAVHYTAEKATAEYEAARDAVKDFINAEDRSEIIFTSGATASLNLVASSFSRAFLRRGDEIIIAESEHHSDIVPWQIQSEQIGFSIKILPVDEQGELRIDLLESLITPSTKLLCLAHISNVLGITNPLKQIISICHSKNCKVLADGSQAIVHTRVDVQDLDCDFYVFSGHKMYAAPGTGVLYGKKQLLENMPPFLSGGEMIGTVKWSGSTYALLPQKFEAGTQNISATPTFGPAIQAVLESFNYQEETDSVRDYVLDELKSRPEIRLYGDPSDRTDKIPLFSFTVRGAHHEDLALILDKMGIAVRSGQMCAEPLMDRYEVTGMLRASFAPYNTIEEAEYFIKCLDKAVNMLV